MSIYRGSGGAGTSADTAAIDEITALAAQVATNTTAAATSAINAATSATSATSSKNSASTYASNALQSAGNSASSASQAATYKTAAETAQTAAETAQAAAEAAQTAAETAETNASGSATAAASSASAASTSASAASTAQTAAETAKTAAETAQAATEAVFTQFGDQYLGSKASEPTLDNSGAALTTGDVYWDSTNNVLKFYSGSAWVAPEDVASTAATNASNSATAAASSASAAATSASNASTSETNAQTYATAFLNSEAYNITSTNTSNWNTAYGWGNHASAGYLTSIEGFSVTAGTLTTANVTTVDFGNWTVTESAGVLYFATLGTNKMMLDASGNLTVVGSITAGGTI